MVKTHTPTTSKVNAQGKTCLFTCYATDHTKGCFTCHDGPADQDHCSFQRCPLWLNWMYFQSWGTPGAPGMVNGPTQPAEDGSVADSDESISTAGKDEEKKIGNLSKTRNSSNSSDSVDSYNSNESYRSTDMDYTQQDGTQLDPYQ